MVLLRQWKWSLPLWLCVIWENWNVLIIIADFCNCWHFDLFNDFNLIEIFGWIIFAAAVTSQSLKIEKKVTWVCSYLQLGFCQLNLRIALCRIVFLVSMSVPKNKNFLEKKCNWNLHLLIHPYFFNERDKNLHQVCHERISTSRLL